MLATEERRDARETVAVLRRWRGNEGALWPRLPLDATCGGLDQRRLCKSGGVLGVMNSMHRAVSQGPGTIHRGFIEYGREGLE